MMEFASLHTHSHNSILDGYSTIPEYIARAGEIGMRGMGLSDHGNLSASMTSSRRPRLPT